MLELKHRKQIEKQKINQILLISITMQLTKQNIVSFQVLLSENLLANNFGLIEEEFKKIKLEISNLKQNSMAIIDKINDIDPFQTLEFKVPKHEHLRPADLNTSSIGLPDIPESKIQILKTAKPEASQAAIQLKENLEQVCKNSQKSKVERRICHESRESEVSIRPASRVRDSHTGQKKGNQSMIRQFIRDLEGRMSVLQSQKLKHKSQLETLQRQNEVFKKMLGYKQSKSKQKKNSAEMEQKAERRSSKMTQKQRQQKVEQILPQIAEPIEDKQEGDETQSNFISEFKKQILDIQQFMRTRINSIDNKLEKCMNEVGQSKIQIKDIKNQSSHNSKMIQSLQNKMQASMQSQGIPCFPVYSASTNNQGRQKTPMIKTKTSLLSDHQSPSGYAKAKTSSSDVANLNDTIESYRNYYEDKIVEIFEEMDRIRGEYFQVIQKLNAEGDVGNDMDKLKSIAQKISKISNPTEQRLKKQLNSIKKQLRKFKQEFNDLMFDINTGSSETRTLVIKANQNKQDWKDVTQKIYKLRQQVLSYVKQLEAKINANNDLTIVIQQLEVGISECKILNGKKVNITDFQKFGKRVETRLNNFIRQVCEKEGMACQQEALLVKQPWFCLSCDSQIKNYTGKVGKATYTEKMAGKKVNPESHMVRRPQSKLPSVH